MSLELQDTKKVPKLKVTPEMDEEQICAQLKNLQQIQEIKLDLLYPRNLSLVFQLVYPFLREQNDLTKISVEINSNTSFQFDQTLYLLKDLTKLTGLSIILSGLVHFDFKQQITLSQCFYNYTNLLEFTVSIDSKFLDNKADIFRLYDVYQRNPSLTKLEISMFEINNKSLVPDSILSGINLLTKLEHFDFKVFKSKIQLFAITEFLEVQLKEKIFLKVLKFYFGWQSIFVNSDMISLNKILSSLKSLDNFSIEASNATTKINWKEIGLERSFSSLINLKSLKLELSDCNSLKFLIETIASMKQLEKVDLSFNLQQTVSYENNLEKFGEPLAQIQSLHSLKISLNYRCSVELIQLFNFISGFYSTKSLKELDISLSSAKDNEKEPTIDQEKLNETISNLKKFMFGFYRYKKNSKIEESILHAIIKAEDLEEISLKINNHDDSRDVNSTNELYQLIINNKKKLKKIDVNYLLTNDQYESEDNQNCELISRLSQNPSLKSISLSFKKSIPNSFPILNGISQSITSLENLRSLIIKFEEKFYPNDQGMDQLSETLKQMKNLHQFEFNFQMDQLQIKSLNNFTSSFESLKKLSCLCLEISSNISYDDEEQIEFAKHFFFPLKIHYLNLKLNLINLKFRNIENIYKNISKLRKLSYLDIHLVTTDLNYFDCVCLKNYFSDLKQLKALEMSYFAFSLLQLISLFQDIESLNRIIIFHSFEDFERSKFKASRKIIYQNPENAKDNEQNQNEVSFEKISLLIENNYLFTENEFADDKYSNLKDIFDSILPLTKLKLQVNTKSSSERKQQQQFFQHLGCLVNLQYLSLKVGEGNEDLSLLGDALITLPRLKKLFLVINDSSNNFDSQHYSDFFFYLGHLRSLVQFELSLAIKSSYFGMDVVNQIDQETVISLFQNVREMKALQKLKIELKNVEMDELCLGELNQMFSGLKENLKGLEFLVKTKSFENRITLLNCFSNLTNLLSLKIAKFNLKLNKLRKLIRLVNLKECKDNHEFNDDEEEI